jgi:hypothetical protein
VEKIRGVFVDCGRIRAIWRFTIFLGLYFAAGKIFDLVLPNFPVRSFTWSTLFLNQLIDFAIVAGVAWVMSGIGRERFATYGLPLVPKGFSLFMKGVFWGIVPSVLIVIPIWLAGACSFHGLALHGSALAVSALGWGMAFLGVGFAEEFTFRGYSLKTLAHAASTNPRLLSKSQYGCRRGELRKGVGGLCLIFVSGALVVSTAIGTAESPENSPRFLNVRSPAIISQCIKRCSTSGRAGHGEPSM